MSPRYNFRVHFRTSLVSVIVPPNSMPWGDTSCARSRRRAGIHCHTHNKLNQQKQKIHGEFFKKISEHLHSTPCGQLAIETCSAIPEVVPYFVYFYFSDRRNLLSVTVKS